MKKSFLVITAALFLSACTAAPTNREATNSSSNTNKPAETKPAAVTEADVVAKEKEVWGTLEKKDYTAFGALLADDFIYVTGDGVHAKADSIKVITGFSPSNMVFSDWKFVPVGKSAGVITFTVKADATMNGEKLPPIHSRDTSVWVNRGGKLVAVYHQDTNVMAATAPPSPAPKPAASPASSTAAPATLTSDAEANEKAVWAAFVAKQWDTFASYLATDFVETAADGFYDKAGSVKGVQGIDFSKAVLSGWKTVKIDDDSALVTYTATDPTMKPGTWYHSSVWSTRDGKWLGVFHQGTPQAPPAPASVKKTP